MRLSSPRPADQGAPLRAGGRAGPARRDDLAPRPDDDPVLSHSKTSGTPRGNRPRASSSIATQRCAESHHTSISGTSSAALSSVPPLMYARSGVMSGSETIGEPQRGQN